ncbi:glutathione gamma-glutamylcysteinyltransferase 1-like [Panicum miliaceum]|uniref:glutathione gamma-glutamylcysteinyltransferase n=1 Tax=Panicum miliaceum TaxID=4540 RepID=A0A3L6R565_PANMI|nr:glutathione gamma-glutamylcysteinyltransferase 1-like [Panicum miliaceum]
MAAAVASLYRRVLPSPPAVDFASPEGKRLFAEALAAGTMEGFFPLVSCFQTQSEPAFCGLASLAVVLNALAIDPGRRWKGPWRWFDESMLDCCEPLDKVKAEGITFGKVACLARCSGAEVQSFRANRENVLQQVRDTRLFAIVHDQQYANNPCCNCSSSSEEDSLTRIAAAVCCQGAAMLSGNFALGHGFCCSETCLKCVQANGDGLKTVISASVVSEGNEQGVDMLLPMSSPGASSCNSNLKKNAVKYPSSADVLTVLLLALHPSTWLGIKDEKLKAELQTLVSTDNLPDELKREIMHLRRQLYYLKACKEKEEDEDDDPPSPK